MIRPTVRLRLTAWYGSIFLLGGAALLAISYVIVSNNISSFPTRVARQLVRSGAPAYQPASRTTGNSGTKSPATTLSTTPAGGSANLPGPIVRNGGRTPSSKTATTRPNGATPLPRPTRAYLVQLARAQAAAENVVRGEIHRQLAIDFVFALLGTTL